MTTKANNSHLDVSATDAMISHDTRILELLVQDIQASLPNRPRTLQAPIAVSIETTRPSGKSRRVMAADKADGITVSINGKPVKTRIIRVYVGELADSAALVDSVYLEVVKASYQTSIGKPSKPYLTALKALGLTEKEERSKEALEAISELVKSLPALRCKDVKLPKPAAKPATALTAKPSAKKNEEEKDEESKDEPAQAPKQPVLTSKKAITYLAAQIAQGNLTMEQLKVELEKQLDRCYKALDEAKALDSKKKIA